MIAIKFYNHGEMMVRNAVRIIALTVFKLNDPGLNALLSDLPFVTYFTNLALLFRSKILSVDASYAGPLRVTGLDSMFHGVDDVQDLLEFFHEVFEVEN